MTQIKITHLEQPSRSKGWARYRLQDEDGQPVLTSRTGNEWLYLGSGNTLVKPRICETAASRLRIEMQVMLREGKGRYRGETVYSASARMAADSGAESLRLDFSPGSQGATVELDGVELMGEHKRSVQGTVLLEAE